MPSFWSQEISCALCDLKGRTDDVIVRPHALRTRSAKVAGDDTLDPGLLGGEHDVLLVAERGACDSADEHGDALECLLEALNAVSNVARTDLDASSAEGLRRRLGDGRRAYKGCNTL